MLFSRRNKYKKARDSIQVEALDELARNRLWTVYNELLFREYNPRSASCYPRMRVRGSNLELFVSQVWIDVFQRPIDTMPNDINEALRPIRELHFCGEWHAAFDILEVLVATLPPETRADEFVDMVNASLERESVGYRLVDGQVVQITDEEELREIDAAIEAAPQPVKIHLQNALRHIADRRAPDYRNSIKESISAVESAVKLIAKDDKATLGQLLKCMRLHPALEKGFAAIYGYTSDADGIRHGLMDEPTLSAADARFFLVVCSAFVNYASEKAP